MLAIAAFCVSLMALLFSGIALVITYRKEAHRIRLELAPAKYGGVILGISNDSGIDTLVRSIGHFRRFGKVGWISDSVGDHVTNKSVEFPFTVKARSTFEVFINTAQKIPKFSNAVGLCIQLDTGRLYVLPQSVPWNDSLRMHFSAWVSHFTGGKYAPGVKRPRIKVRQ
ncbi:MAG: hypothetical protein Q8J80_04460 [Gallionella sp.]|nr:hypothetical protein [Gallionella sp.]